MMREHSAVSSLFPNGRILLNASPHTKRNLLLHSLPLEDLARLEPHLRPVTLEVRRTFSEPGAPIREVCFPDSGIISVVARVGNGRSIETGLIGFEGMTGLPILLGADRWPNETYVQMPGYGRVLDADILREALAASPTMQARFLRYAQVFTVLTGQTALANGRAKIDERLARWLLMASDRLERDEMPLTHEFLALMLGVRRPGVTDALHRLEGDLLIRARRGSITIRDREGLERAANGSYGVPEAEYRRLFGAYTDGTGRRSFPRGELAERAANQV